jgi:hypothetical protein
MYQHSTLIVPKTGLSEISKPISAKSTVHSPFIVSEGVEHLISEEMNCDVLIRSLALVFLYSAPTFGYTKASAAEFAREQVKH